MFKKMGSRMSRKSVKKEKPKKPEKMDGLGPDEIRRIRAAIRQVWHQSSLARKICVKRCIGAGGYSYCEQCGKRAPKVFIDHIERVGDVDAGFIERLFVPSYGLQGLCKRCHQDKTNEENALKRLEAKRAKPMVTETLARRLERRLKPYTKKRDPEGYGF